MLIKVNKYLTEHITLQLHHSSLSMYSFTRLLGLVAAVLVLKAYMTRCIVQYCLLYSVKWDIVRMTMVVPKPSRLLA